MIDHRPYPENDERPVDVFLARDLELDRLRQEFWERLELPVLHRMATDT